MRVVGRAYACEGCDEKARQLDEARKILAAVLIQVGPVVVSGMTVRGVDWIGGRFVREESEHGGFLLRFEQGQPAGRSTE